MTKFLRRLWNKHQKLGKNRKKKRVWRRPKGRHNKMREKRKGYPVVVGIGYKKEQKPKLALVNNLNDLNNIKQNEIIILGKIGRKKKIEIVKKAEEKNIKLSNLSIKKFLRKNIKNKEKVTNEPKKEKNTGN